MFIEYVCQDNKYGKSACAEIATFYGIRFNPNGFAVLDTEHKAHDYLLPMNAERYKIFSGMLMEAMGKKPYALRITGSVVYRVKRGAILPLEDKRQTDYGLEIIS